MRNLKRRKKIERKSKFETGRKLKFSKKFQILKNWKEKREKIERGFWEVFSFWIRRKNWKVWENLNLEEISSSKFGGKFDRKFEIENKRVNKKAN